GGATGLAVGVGEQYTLAGNAIEVGCTPPHHATVVGTNVEPADIVGHDRQDVGKASDRLSRNRLLSLRHLDRGAGAQRGSGCEGGAAEQNVAPIESAILRFGLASIAV